MPAAQARGLGGLSGGGDVVARVGVEAGGLAGGWLVGARGAGRLGWTGRWSRRSGRRRRRGRGLAIGRLVGAGRAGGLRRTGRWSRRSGPRRRRVQAGLAGGRLVGAAQAGRLARLAVRAADVVSRGCRSGRSGVVGRTGHVDRSRSARSPSGRRSQCRNLVGAGSIVWPIGW